MKFKRIIFIAAVILLPSILQNCAPTLPAEKEKIIPPERLIKKIEGNRRKVKTFAGNGVINIESPKFSGTASFEVKMKKPDSIKISIYGPFGIDLAHGLVSKNDFEFYDVMNNTLYTGNTDAQVLSEIFKMDLSFDDLIDAFSGSINLTDKLLKEPDHYYQNDDDFVLSYDNNTSKTRSTFLIKNDNLALLKYQLDDLNKNSQILESEYKEIELFDGVPIPYKTYVNYFKNDQKLVLDYRKIRINKDLNDLRINVPKDVKIVRW